MSEVDWHREMLADRRRVQAFGGAVLSAVQPGDVVLDLGTGSGLLALIACRAGAARVYAIEQGHIIDVARQIARENGLADKITFFHGCSTEVELPEPVDLIISEIIGSFGLEEQILESLSNARRRFLKPEGRLMPDGLDIFLAPTEEGAEYRGWLGKMQDDWELDFSALDDFSAHVVQGICADPGKFLGEPARLLHCDLYRAEPGRIEDEVGVEIQRSGELAGWTGWFSACYKGGIVLSTAPPLTESSWENVLFPIGEPVRVAPGDVACLKVDLDDPFWTWRFTMSRPPVDRVMGDFFSYPPSVFKPPPEERNGLSKNSR